MNFSILLAPFPIDKIKKSDVAPRIKCHVMLSWHKNVGNEVEVESFELCPP